MSTDETLNELKNGNQRFVDKKTKSREKKPADLANGQSPKTIVLTCADSRVPPELIFDQDLGDLFVIRIAGNTASDEAIGSAEYAAANLGSRLLVVLGHSKCGAVGAAIDHKKTGDKLPSPCLDKVVEPILQCIESGSDNVENVVNKNVKHAETVLVEKSEILRSLRDKEGLKIVGAKYDLASGKVDFI